MKVIDLFCGCGGLSYGFKQAGFDIEIGVDVNLDAIKTFQYNFPKANAQCFDLLELDDKKIKQVFGDLNDIDVIIGGPPCQGFSSANRYKKEEEDVRNKLFFEFVKFVDIAQPKIVVIENVRGIITNDNGYARKRIYEIFESRGYIVNHKLLDASDFGVPQKRIRNFFIMSKSKKFDFETLKKNELKITVKEALEDLYELENIDRSTSYRIQSAPKSKYAKEMRNSDNVVQNHEIYYPAEIVQERIKYVKQGENWSSIPPELFSNNRNNRHSSAYKRLNEADVSVTIDTGNAHSNYFHPIYNRIPTVREAARLQSFNDSFVFQGSKSAQYRQVGNAVPPLLAKSIAIAIKEFIENE